MAEVCEAAGADVTVLADAIGYDDRIGKKFLPGYRSRAPRDIRAGGGRRAWRRDEALTFLRGGRRDQPGADRDHAVAPLRSECCSRHEVDLFNLSNT